MSWCIHTKKLLAKPQANGSCICSEAHTLVFLVNVLILNRAFPPILGNKM